jgi:hypothetical protein
MTRQPRPRPATTTATPDASAAPSARPTVPAGRLLDRPRAARVAHVFRTHGRGLVAEYDPA